MLLMRDIFLGSTVRASHIVRYSTIPVHHQESVAEHSFYVALYTTLMGRALSCEPSIVGAAVQYALIHDIDECLTGDFLRSFKYSDPLLTKAIHSGAEQAAGRILQELGDPSLLGYWVDAKSHRASGMLVRFADFLSVGSYLFREASLGSAYAIRMLKTEYRTYMMSFGPVEWTIFVPWLDEISVMIDREEWNNVRITV